jgi:endonuclease/exonuclease/phosphatase family metal-dependent hydrolase
MRIVEVLREIDADMIVLQEVISIKDSQQREHDQARFISEELGFDYRIGANRKLKNADYGNVTLSRLPFRETHNYDISWRGRERRGCLRTDVVTCNAITESEMKDALLHVFNVHLGTAFIERRRQAQRLLSDEILNNSELKGPRLVLGDFNEWTRGLASRLLAEHFTSADVRHHLRHGKTYPGVLPVLHLDHIYYDATLELMHLTLHRSRIALIASDHLPLIADFRLPMP